MEINIKNLNYKNIFENLNLNIKENKVTLILTKSETQKTALLNLLFGKFKDYTGDILLGDKKVEYDDISYLEQENNSFFNINLLEDITYNLKKYDKEELNDMLKLFNLDDTILNKNYLEISNSEYRKLYIIATFIRNSKIIVLDNPTIGLDQKSIQTLIKIIKRTKRKNKIIITLSNDSNFLLQIIDDIIIIDNDEIIKFDNKYEFFDNKKILSKINIDIPDIIKFKNILLKEKNIKLNNQDNINDLIKEIYRNA